MISLIAAAVITIAGAVPSITGDGNGGFVVSYIDGDSFRFVTIRGDKMSAPREIAKGNLLVNRADFPSIAMRGKTMFAQWSTRNGHGAMVHLARSDDGGVTWSRARTPHPPVASQFGFVSLTPNGDAVWLDGRGLKGGVEGEGDMQLWFNDTAIDGRVCDCCQTAMAMTSNGPIVAYRDRSDDETRDIAVIRRTSNGWTKPKVVHKDGWKIPGCPVNGPQLDANGKRVAIAWFTAVNDQPRVYAAYSNDAGATFSAPVRIDSGNAAGRVDIALLANGSAVASWVEHRPDRFILFARRVGSAPVEIASDPRGFPRIAVSKENVGVVWAAAERVHFKTIQLP